MSWYNRDMNCVDCGKELPKSRKPNLSGRCLKCRQIAAKSSNSPETKAFQASYREANREKRLAEKRAWYQANKEHKMARDKINKEANPELYKRLQNEYQKKRCATDPQYKLRKLLRSSLKRGLFKSNKSILDLIDCTIEEMKQHIESQFTPEMTWDNHGAVWHIDHIKPLCAFDLTKEDEIREATKRSNLQPLLIRDNLEKSAKDKMWKN
jgi:hypothetical protein